MVGGAMNFLVAVRRRVIFARLVEAAALGLAIGCALAMPMIWIGGFNGACGLVIGVSVVAITGLGLRRWPSLHEVAVVADEQFNLHDLLSSTLALKDHEDFRGAMLQQANYVTKEFAPSEVLVWRWGIKRFAGVGLMAAFTLSIALLQAAPSVSNADETSLSAAGKSGDASAVVEAMSDDSLKLDVQKQHVERLEKYHGESASSSFGTREKNGAAGNANAKGGLEKAPVLPSAESDSERGESEVELAVKGAQGKPVASDRANGRGEARGSHESHRDDVPGEYRDLIREYLK